MNQNNASVSLPFDELKSKAETVFQQGLTRRNELPVIDAADLLAVEQAPILAKKVKLVAMLNGYIFPDDLDNILDSTEGYEHVLGVRVVEAVNDAMRAQFERVTSLIEDVDNESTLDDHIKAIKRLAPRVGITNEDLERAVTEIEQKKSEIEETSRRAEAPSFSPHIPLESRAIAYG